MDYIYIAMLDIALRHSMKQKSHAMVPTKCKHGSLLNAELFFLSLLMLVCIFVCLAVWMKGQAIPLWNDWIFMKPGPTMQW